MYLHQYKELPSPSVTPLRLPELVRAVDRISRELPFNQYWSRKDNIAQMQQYEQQFREWYSPLIDLERFPHCYFLNNGITQGLEWLALKYHSQKIHLETGDYFWLKFINVGQEVPKPITCDVSYRTDPSAIVGMAGTTSWDSQTEILDGAYVGTALHRTHTFKNTEHVLLGFSKNIGFPELRCGLLFCKNKLEWLPVVQRVVGYVGMRNFTIISELIKQFSIIDLANALKEAQSLYCHKYPEHGFVPSDSAILATTTNSDFSWYKRPNGVIRVPLGESITHDIDNLNRTLLLCKNQ